MKFDTFTRAERRELRRIYRVQREVGWNRVKARFIVQSHADELAGTRRF